MKNKVATRNLKQKTKKKHNKMFYGIVTTLHTWIISLLLSLQNHIIEQLQHNALRLFSCVCFPFFSLPFLFYFNVSRPEYLSVGQLEQFSTSGDQTINSFRNQGERTKGFLVLSPYFQCLLA